MKTILFVLSLIMFIIFQVWWMSLPGFFHWEGFVATFFAACCGWLLVDVIT